MIQEKNNQRIFPLLLLVFILIVVQNIVVIPIRSEYAKENFSINNEEKIYLNLESSFYYNGNITVTVTLGTNVTFTINTVNKEVTIGESKTITFNNVSHVVFKLASEGLSQGFFELNINTDINYKGNRTIIIICAILGGLLFMIATVSYYVRSERLKRKPGEEDLELLDPEEVKRRKEAAGAEERFWGKKK